MRNPSRSYLLRESVLDASLRLIAAGIFPSGAALQSQLPGLTYAHVVRLRDNLVHSERLTLPSIPRVKPEKRPQPVPLWERKRKPIDLEIVRQERERVAE